MRLMIAAMALVFAGAAYAAEPFPNLDVNKAALATTLEMLDFADRAVHSPQYTSDKDLKDSQAFLDTDRDVLFNHFLAGEIKARNYLVAHWAGYTEYYQALCLQSITKRPGYLSLLMCFPDSFPTANSIISDSSDLPLVLRQ